MVEDSLKHGNEGAASTVIIELIALAEDAYKLADDDRAADSLAIHNDTITFVAKTDAEMGLITEAFKHSLNRQDTRIPPVSLRRDFSFCPFPSSLRSMGL